VFSWLAFVTRQEEPLGVRGFRGLTLFSMGIIDGAGQEKIAQEEESKEMPQGSS
jgi:hypothetical protein